MEDEDAISGLKRLGLTTYEARVFLALQKLQSATASEVSEVADVPRSQVYGAAEGLEERGLVETQQSTPTVYRPMPLDQARTRLLDQLAETGARTFDYLDSVQNTEQQRERSEAIWLVNGREGVVSRTVELTKGADDSLLYAVDDPAMLEDDIVEALRVTGEQTVVIVASVNPAVHEILPDDHPAETFLVPEDREMDVDVGRLLIADEQTLLLSTQTAAENSQEIAFWSDDTAFATVLVELAEEWLYQPFDA